MKGVPMPLSALLAALLLTTTAEPAFADLTGFLGVSTTPDARPVKGVALGSGLLVLGFEFEYAATDADVPKGAPSIKSGMGNVLLQTPVAVFRMQPYFTTGAGYYQEALQAREDSGFGFNTGGGVKVNLIGPLRVRVDYRVFRLTDDALHPTAHRLYAGLNLKF